MSKYLINGSYTHQGIQGLVADSATQRVGEVRKLVEAVGGNLESMYFSLGADDFTLIADIPDDNRAVAAVIVASASGAVDLRTTTLLTAEELDDGLATARPIAAAFRAPGQS